MPYKPVEDIPNIDDLRLDFRKVNPKMQRLIQYTRLALNHRYNYKRKLDYSDELSAFLKNQLLLYQGTHNSIHILIKYAIREKYNPPVVDAASLVREQIEKIYSITLVLTNPHKWIKQNLRAAWRGDYQDYLLQLEEQANSPRYDDFLNKYYPKFLKQAQRPPSSSRIIKPEVFVSEFAKKVLTYHWNNPIGRKPVWFRRKGSIWNYITDYFEFPTPGKSIKYVPGKAKKRFLFRWHKEYSYFSEYAHAGFEKVLIPTMDQSKNLRVAEKLDIHVDTLFSRVIFTSYIAIASACTLIIPEMKDNYGSKRLLKEFWGELNDSSLLARALWKIYAEDRLK